MVGFVYKLFIFSFLFFFPFFSTEVDSRKIIVNVKPLSRGTQDACSLSSLVVVVVVVVLLVVMMLAVYWWWCSRWSFDDLPYSTTT